MENSNPNEGAIFEAALEIASSEERAAYLDKACLGRPALRRSVEALLDLHLKAGNFLEPAAGSTVKINIPSEEKPGDKIGHYKLREKIGEGGFGVVYVADQEQPVKRRVALKVVKLGMDTKQVIARFEAERQALALMDHPNIAKVLDAGTTDKGRPFFVMELVRGIKITDYCDQNHLSTEERLKLFIQVCQAVQHAHQKGIIHRDIKPSNVLVTLHDGVPVPKVIDFGIAKATNNQQLTDKTIYTAFEQFMGTPAYMSPEQAEMSGLDIDTRSDIYSLGVLLYELLTGKTPFDPKTLLAAGLDQMRRIIRNQEPPKPSTCLGTLTHADLSTTALQRKTEAPRLLSNIRGDLDWIVMKCLEKDRVRRYETASTVASDIKRHLEQEPIEARPPSQLYRLQKMVLRNKFAVLSGSAIVLLLIVGLGISTWFFHGQKIALQRALAAESTQDSLQKEVKANNLMYEGIVSLEKFDLRDSTDDISNAPIAEACFSNAMALRLGLHGSNDPSVLEALNQFIYIAQYRQHDKATKALLEKFQRFELEITEKLRGSNSMETAWSINDLVGQLEWTEPESLPEQHHLLERVLGIYAEKNLRSAAYTNTIMALFHNLCGQKKFAEAETLAQKEISKLDFDERIKGYKELSEGLISEKLWVPAEHSIRQLQQLRNQKPPEDIDYALANRELAYILRQRDLKDEPAALEREAETIEQATIQFPIDPSTGLPMGTIDPNTGLPVPGPVIDPNTGLPIKTNYINLNLGLTISNLNYVCYYLQEFSLTQETKKLLDEYAELSKRPEFAGLKSFVLDESAEWYMEDTKPEEAIGYLAESYNFSEKNAPSTKLRPWLQLQTVRLGAKHHAEYQTRLTNDFLDLSDSRTFKNFEYLDLLAFIRLRLVFPSDELVMGFTKTLNDRITTELNFKEYGEYFTINTNGVDDLSALAAYSLYDQGLIQFRLHEYSTALDFMTRSEQYDEDSDTSAVLAMIQFHLGRFDDAKQSLAEAKKLCNDLPKDRWEDKIISVVFIEEAENLIQNKATNSTVFK